MNMNFMNGRIKCLNEIISCTSLPLCKVLYWVSMIPEMNYLGHLNKRFLLMSGALLSLHSLFQQLWWDYGSWEASLNSCTPVHLQLTSLIFHHLKLFLLKDCLWSETNIFFSSLNYRFWLPLLVLFQREKKKSNKIILKGRKTWRKGTTKTQMLNENKAVDLLPFSQTLVSASLRTVYIRDLQKNIWLTTWRQLFWDLHEQGLKNICHRIKNVKNWMWREIKKQGCQIIFSRETSNTF